MLADADDDTRTNALSRSVVSSSPKRRQGKETGARFDSTMGEKLNETRGQLTDNETCYARIAVILRP